MNNLDIKTSSSKDTPLPSQLPTFFNIDPSLVIFSFSLFTPDAVRCNSALIDTIELGRHVWYSEVITNHSTHQGGEDDDHYDDTDGVDRPHGEKRDRKAAASATGSTKPTTKARRVGDLIIRFPTIKTVQESVIEEPIESDVAETEVDEEAVLVVTARPTVELPPPKSATSKPPPVDSMPPPDFSLPSEVPLVNSCYFDGVPSMAGVGMGVGGMGLSHSNNNNNTMLPPSMPTPSGEGDSSVESSYYPLASTLPNLLPGGGIDGIKASVAPPLLEPTPLADKPRRTQFKVKRTIRYHDSVVCNVYANGTVTASASRFVDSMFLVAEHIRTYLTSTLLSKCPWAIQVSPAAHHAFFEPLAVRVLNNVPAAANVVLQEYTTMGGGRLSLQDVCRAVVDPVNMVDTMVTGGRIPWLSFEVRKRQEMKEAVTAAVPLRQQAIHDNVGGEEEGGGIDSVYPHNEGSDDGFGGVEAQYPVGGGGGRIASIEQGPTEKHLHKLRCLLGVSPLYAHINATKPPLYSPDVHHLSDGGGDHGDGYFSYFLDPNGVRNWNTYHALCGIIIDAHQNAARARAEARRERKNSSILGKKRQRDVGGVGGLEDGAFLPLHSSYYGASSIAGGNTRTQQGMGSVLYGSEMDGLAALASCLPSAMMGSSRGMPEPRFEALSVVHRGSTTRDNRINNNSLVDQLLGKTHNHMKQSRPSPKVHDLTEEEDEEEELCPYVSSCLLATEDVEKELMGLHGFTISNFFAVIKPTQDALSAREFLLGHGGLSLTKESGRGVVRPPLEGDRDVPEEAAAFSYDFGSVLYGVATDLAATLANLGQQMDKDGSQASKEKTPAKQQHHIQPKKKRASAATVSDVGMEVSEFQQMIELLAGRAQVTFDVDQGNGEEVVLNDAQSALKAVAQASSSALQGGKGFNGIPPSRTSSPANYVQSLQHYSAAATGGGDLSTSAQHDSHQDPSSLFSLNDRVLLKAHTLDMCRFQYLRHGRVTEVSIRRNTGYIRVLKATDLSDVYIVANGILPTIMGLLQGHYERSITI